MRDIDMATPRAASRDRLGRRPAPTRAYRQQLRAQKTDANTERIVNAGLTLIKTSRRLAEITSAYDLRGVAYDRWRIEDLRKVLADEGIELPLIDWGQGFQSMGPAVDALEIAIIDRRLKHGGNPILTWCIANAVVETDAAGARKISKSRSVERVDGAVALAMAIGLHSRTPQMELDFDRPLVLSV